MDKYGISIESMAESLGITSMGVRKMLKREKIKPITFNAAMDVIGKKSKQSLVHQIETQNPNHNPAMIETAVNALSKAVDALSDDNKHLREQNEYANELIRDYLKLNNVRAKQG